MSAIKSIYIKFNEDIEKTYKLLNNSSKLFEDNKTEYNKDLHYLVVESCFINIYNSWELFIEDSFISYLLGNPDLKNKQYCCCVKPKNASHAYNIVKGTKIHPKWTDTNELSCLADIFFENKGPFICFDKNPIELVDIKAIRNIISHKSKKAQENFKKVLIRNITDSTDIRAGEFLMRPKNSGTTYFSYYDEAMRLFVDEICNAQ